MTRATSRARPALAAGRSTRTSAPDLGGDGTDLRTVCVSRTCLRTFAANLGSPLEATDFSRSVTFSKSCVGRRERGGGSAEERQRPAAASRERARSVRAKPDPGAPNRLCTLPTSEDSRGTHHIQHVLRGDGRLLLRRLLLIFVRPVFHLHVRAHRGRRTSVSRCDVAATENLREVVQTPADRRPLRRLQWSVI